MPTHNFGPLDSAVTCGAMRKNTIWIRKQGQREDFLRSDQANYLSFSQWLHLKCRGFAKVSANTV